MEKENKFKSNLINEQKEMTEQFRRLRHYNNKLIIIGNEGCGKSHYAKELHKYIVREFNKPNWIKVLELFGLCLVHQLLIGVLLYFVALFGVIPFIAFMCLNAVLVWEVYFKPIWKELIKLK